MLYRSSFPRCEFRFHYHSNCLQEAELRPFFGWVCVFSNSASEVAVVVAVFVILLVLVVDDMVTDRNIGGNEVGALV